VQPKTRRAYLLEGPSRRCFQCSSFACAALQVQGKTSRREERLQDFKDDNNNLLCSLAHFSTSGVIRLKSSLQHQDQKRTTVAARRSRLNKPGVVATITAAEEGFELQLSCSNFDFDLLRLRTDPASSQFNRCC
jgi:hypothetical protein